MLRFHSIYSGFRILESIQLEPLNQSNKKNPGIKWLLSSLIPNFSSPQSPFSWLINSTTNSQSGTYRWTWCSHGWQDISRLSCPLVQLQQQPIWSSVSPGLKSRPPRESTESSDSNDDVSFHVVVYVCFYLWILSGFYENSETYDCFVTSEGNHIDLFDIYESLYILFCHALYFLGTNLFIFIPTCACTSPNFGWKLNWLPSYSVWTLCVFLVE
jgi:hypothetical protein